MNPRSDVDFSSPKVDLMVNLSEVAIELNRPQVGLCCAWTCLCESFVLERGRETEKLKTNKVRENEFRI